MNLDTLGLDPQLYAAMGALGALNALLKARVKEYTQIWSLIVAAIFAAAFGTASWVQEGYHPIDGMTHVLVLLVAALAVDFGLNVAGLKNNVLTEAPKPEDMPGK